MILIDTLCVHINVYTNVLYQYYQYILNIQAVFSCSFRILTKQMMSSLDVLSKDIYIKTIEVQCAPPLKAVHHSH